MNPTSTIKSWSTVIMIGLFLICACGQTQSQQPNPPVYALRFITVSGTHPRQTLWMVDGGNPNIAYKSLQDAHFLEWVSKLPKGSEIDYRSPWDSLPVLGHGLKDHYGDSFIPDADMGGQLKALKAYCQGKGILFCDQFPVL